MQFWPKTGGGCCCEGDEDEVVDSECGCAVSPVTIYSWSTHPGTIGPSGKVTLTHQYVPELEGKGIPTSGWLSDSTYGTAPDEYKIYIYCNDVQYFYGIFPIDDYNGAAAYAWTTGGAGNPCDPFYQLSGASIGLGSTPQIYLSEVEDHWGIGEKMARVFCRHNSFAIPAVGATVEIGGVEAITGADGSAVLFVPQSTSARTITVTKPGYTTVTGSLPGTALQSTLAQVASVNINVHPPL